MNIDHIYKKIVKPEFTDIVTVCSVSYSSEEKSFIACLATYIDINAIHSVSEYFSKIGLNVLYLKPLSHNQGGYTYLLLINYSNYDEQYKFENDYGCVDLRKTQIHLQELLSA